MLTLYVKTGCPYCNTVRAFVQEHNIKLEEKNVAEPNVLQELLQRGGERKVPFLVDHNAGVMLYESGLIIDYLKENYTPSAVVAGQESGCSECG